MSETTTILDYLIEDCWHSVLDYVPLGDIIRSERTSRRWQEVVLKYLSHIRIGIKYPSDIIGGDAELSTETLYNARWLILEDTCIPSFEMWTSKLGASVVACYCNKKSLKVVGEKCPNLEAAKFRLDRDLLRYNPYENLTRLKAVIFEESVSDKIAKKFISSPFLEELEFDYNFEITGLCLKSIKSPKLKSLRFHGSQNLNCRRLLAASDKLGELRSFAIHGIPNKNFEQLLQVLQKMPKLERLNIYDYEGEIHNFFGFVCRFKNLKELGTDFPVTDAELEAVVKSCPKLMTLNLEAADAVTGRGLAAVCARAGARLEELRLSRSEHLTDNDVVAAVRACPKLKVLRVTGCSGLTCAFLPRVAAARRELGARARLRIWVFVDMLLGYGSEEYEHERLGQFEELELPYLNGVFKMRSVPVVSDFADFE